MVETKFHDFGGGGGMRTTAFSGRDKKSGSGDARTRQMILRAEGWKNREVRARAGSVFEGLEGGHFLDRWINTSCESVSRTCSKISSRSSRVLRT